MPNDLSFLYFAAPFSYSSSLMTSHNLFFSYGFLFASIDDYAFY